MLTYIVDVSILFLRKENDMVDKREKLMNSFN
ncbi:transcriptional regulator, partial [Streptococcus pneumoniae]